MQGAVDVELFGVQLKQNKSIKLFIRNILV
jgi:hypothetical protein